MSDPDPSSGSFPSDLLFSGGSELGALMQAYDWTSSPLGPPDTWPATLRVLVRLMLASDQPMYLGWSRELIALYNDAYRPILGADKHPGALGARTAEVIGPDGYPGLEPYFDALLEHGTPSTFKDVLVPLVRYGYLEECYFDLSYTPVYEGQQVAGVFCNVTETTDRVLAARRLRTLATLPAVLQGLAGPAEASVALAQIVRESPHDLPFAQLHLADEDGTLRPPGSGGIGAGPPELHESPDIWSGLDQVPVRLSSPVVAGPWPEPVTHVVRLTLRHPQEPVPLGLLVVGLNPRKHLDPLYRDFLWSVGSQVVSALRDARHARRQQQHNEELAARAQVLDGFASLLRDLSVQGEPERLVERAMTLVLSLLPPGYAAYYQCAGPTWRVVAQVGEVGSPELQAAMEAGFPVGSTPSLDRPQATREPFFQDVYDPALDISPDLIRHVMTIATVPVLVHGGVVGIFHVALFQERPWGPADQAVLLTTVRSLGLALESLRGVTQLAEERHKLAAANEELEAFAYSVSHDLRTPVRHIRGFNALLRKTLAGQLDGKSARYLQMVEESVGRMDTLIDAMLDLSRTARVPLHLDPVDLSALIAAVQTELESESPGRQVNWQVSGLPTVVADPATLRQVVVNLLLNALKYTRTREVARIEVWAEERPDEWAILVRDNGVGFDPRYAHKLFGVFQRLHSQDEYEGTGVGLANVRRIVTRHGGQVWATSVPGQGATFGFTLPRQEAG